MHIVYIANDLHFCFILFYLFCVFNISYIIISQKMVHYSLRLLHFLHIFGVGNERTDPWGTPVTVGNFVTFDSSEPTLTTWDLSSGYGWNHAAFRISKRFFRTSSMIRWSTVSKAADMSRRTSAPTWPLTMNWIISLYSRTSGMVATIDSPVSDSSNPSRQ